VRHAHKMWWWCWETTVMPDLLRLLKVSVPHTGGYQAAPARPQLALPALVTFAELMTPFLSEEDWVGIGVAGIAGK
jgi:hypothetical protein